MQPKSWRDFRTRTQLAGVSRRREHTPGYPQKLLGKQKRRKTFLAIRAGISSVGALKSSPLASLSSGPIGAFVIGLRPDMEMNNAEPRRAMNL